MSHREIDHFLTTLPATSSLIEQVSAVSHHFHIPARTSYEFVCECRLEREDAKRLLAATQAMPAH
ncbi:hypothetical protein [Chitinilyticum litopenaei]|uniref:hypothetical protein n=1 Tax=Chitinilyticum litopenaei TaxID=1121276 RepID=UPI00040FFCCB|nr:hypothetical protein [Chitinilyticum litopenaei]